MLYHKELNDQYSNLFTYVDEMITASVMSLRDQYIENEQGHYLSLFYRRIIESLMASQSLIHRGFLVDCISILRSCIESVIYFNALVDSFEDTKKLLYYQYCNQEIMFYENNSNNSALKKTFKTAEAKQRRNEWRSFIESQNVKNELFNQPVLFASKLSKKNKEIYKVGYLKLCSENHPNYYSIHHYSTFSDGKVIDNDSYMTNARFHQHYSTTVDCGLDVFKTINIKYALNIGSQIKRVETEITRLDKFYNAN